MCINNLEDDLKEGGCYGGEDMEEMSEEQESPEEEQKTSSQATDSCNHSCEDEELVIQVESLQN
jgi:hypothetical protein